MRYRLSHRTSLKLGGVLYHPGDEFEADSDAVAHLRDTLMFFVKLII